MPSTLALVAACAAASPVALGAGTTTTPQPTKPQPTQPEQGPSGIAHFLNPTTSPFIPVPEIDEDPYSGTTLGIIPTFLVKNDKDEISKIIAPDIVHSQYFGWGVHGRIFSYPSPNTQWSIVAGAKQHVESGIDAEYAAGILRQSRWSFDMSVVYDRDGSPHFYGIGNETHLAGQTNYTEQQKYVQTTVGLNLTHSWQVGYTFRARTVKITPGHLPDLPSIQQVYPSTVLHAERQEILNRVFINYDSRDDVVVPTRGADWVLYAGAASSEGLFSASLYSEVGIDGRDFWSLPHNAVLAVHFSLRYMPPSDRTRNIPFWALSSIGGDQSAVGGDQLLRGYGVGRFVDRNSTSISIEYRKRVTTLNLFASQISLEITPFLDMGQVFHRMGDDPFGELHKAVGIGFRGIALPFVVGYVDVGYGNEGAAIFTGLNYPF